MDNPRAKAAPEAPTDIAARRQKTDISLVEPAPPAQKAHQLLRQARLASVDHVNAFEAAMAALHELASAIVEDEDLYGPGLHVLASEIANDMLWKGKRVAMLAQRHREMILPRKPLAHKVADEASGAANPPASPAASSGGHSSLSDTPE